MGLEKVKKELTKKPSHMDVHEQRDAEQPREGVVPDPHPPTQSEIDEQRADWEGMAQDPPNDPRL